MIGYLSLEEQIEADFSRARRKALLRRVRARLRTDAAPDALLCFDEVSKNHGAAVGRVYRGMRTVPVGQIAGSVGRCSEFDGSFMPARASVREMDAHGPSPHRGEGLPPVSLYKVGDFYFVLDGHHRVSVACYHGVEWIDAEVTEFRTELWRDRRDRDSLIEPLKAGELRMREMTGLELASQRHEERLREAESSRSCLVLTREQRSSSSSSSSSDTLAERSADPGGRSARRARAAASRPSGRRREASSDPKRAWGPKVVGLRRDRGDPRGVH